MNIKSLLLGSAAALVAVSGARAADAVMAPEPEPVEYVRVCDAYGAGFFYIPGTETCLQISGLVYYQITASSFETGDTRSYHWGYGTGDGWNKTVRGRLNFDARSETEWGTLRSFIRFQATWNGSGDGEVTADHAYIDLGGFRIGYTDSFWGISGNGGPSNGGSHSDTGMSYGYQQRALIGYRFDSNGFFGALSLEDDALSVGGDGYVPDVVAKIGYGNSWGAVWAKVAYDESYNVLGDDGFAAQLGAHINMPNMPGSSLRLIAFYSDSDNAYGVKGPTLDAAEWSILASYQQRFSEQFVGSVGVQYFSDLYADGTDIGTGIDAWTAELSLAWTPVTNFEIRTELAYQDMDGAPGTASGFLRFTRSF